MEAVMCRLIDYRGYMIAVSAQFAGDEGWLGRYTVTVKDTGEKVHEVAGVAHRRSYESACSAALIRATDYVDGKLPQAPP